MKGQSCSPQHPGPALEAAGGLFPRAFGLGAGRGLTLQRALRRGEGGWPRAAELVSAGHQASPLPARGPRRASHLFSENTLDLIVCSSPFLFR